MAAPTLEVVFLWHMHQPDYRRHGGAGGSVGDGGFELPWTYLHALKDYSDMAAHLERHPKVRCVVNFVPVLLEQLEDYAAQFASGRFRDPLLAMLAREHFSALTAHEREFLLAACFRSNHVTMLAPFPRYHRLHTLYQTLATDGGPALAYLSTDYYADLVTWYHLAWTGEAERRTDPVIAQLLSKGDGYTLADRRALLASIGRVIGGIIPRYRALAERGQIELSATPQTHPLSPLLLDLRSARESQPDAPLPTSVASGGYPGGQTRVQAQIADASASHAARFGAPPVGMWPAEGAISTAFVQHLAKAGIRWIASGEGVLRNSCNASGLTDARAAYGAWSLDDAPGLSLFFRDERLSDLIGFDFAKWHGRDAARHLVAELENIRLGAAPNERCVVGIALDGENAWEHYPYNGWYFFDDLYGVLADHPTLRTTTYGDLIAAGLPSRPLPRLVAGSWVYGTLSTWIGDAAKNRAWDLLCAAKRSLDLVFASGRLDAEQKAAALRQLAVCESSDWFWWFGDYNPSDAVASFDRLYRDNLKRLYRLLLLDAPAQLDVPISKGAHGSAMTSGSMRRAS